MLLLVAVAIGSTHCLGEDVAKSTETTPDAGSPGSASSLLVGGDFEGPGCRGWTANESTTEKDAVARTGTGACKVCVAPGAAGVWNIFQTVPKGAGGTYTVEAWVRASGAAGPSRSYLEMQPNDDQGNFVGESFSSIALLDDTWRPVSVTGTVAKDTAFSIAVLSRDGGACFLVDDVVLRKEP